MPHSSSLLKLLLPVFILGCSSKSNNEFKILNELNNSLEESIQTINRANQIIYHELDDKQFNPGTAYKIQEWLPRSKRVYELTKDLYSYVSDLKTELIKQLNSNNSNKSFVRDKQTVKNLFVNQKKGYVLKSKLMAYRVRLLCCDSIIQKEFTKLISDVTKKIDTSDLKKDFSDYFFQDINVGDALVLLTKLQSNIKIAENKLLNFCNLNVVDNRLIFDTYSQYAALIGQSSSVVKPRETIVITSGVGSFSNISGPSFLINGREIKLNAFNQAVYRFKASSKAGRHFVPVKITYTDQDGLKRIIEETIEYTVSDCKN